MASKVDWAKELQPLLKKYKGKKHPLEYENIYQLLVMVVLSAQDSDRNINSLAPKLFEAYPNMASLSKASPDDLTPYISKVRNFGNKAKWLVKTAQQIKEDKNIPVTMDELTQYSGIGRKSANVIKREAGAPAEGVMVDLHVVRVANRLGITHAGENPQKIEKDIMNEVPEKYWGEVGMAMSHLGREICRPTNPKHSECPVKDVCEFYKQFGKG